MMFGESNNGPFYNLDKQREIKQKDGNIGNNIKSNTNRTTCK